MHASSSPAASSDPQSRVIWALRRAEIAVQARKERLLRPLGMTAAQYALLASIASESGLAGATVARRLDVTPQAVAALVARMVERGVVERRTHPRHANVQELHLTEVGVAALEEADAVMAQIERDVVDALGPDASAALRTSLERLAALPSEPVG